MKSVWAIFFSKKPSLTATIGALPLRSLGAITLLKFWLQVFAITFSVRVSQRLPCTTTCPTIAVPPHLLLSRTDIVKMVTTLLEMANQLLASTAFFLSSIRTWTILAICHVQLEYLDFAACCGSKNGKHSHDNARHLLA